MTIIPRSKWHAVPPTNTRALTSSKLGWIVHYNGPPLPVQLSGAQAMMGIQRYHMVAKGWTDIGYSFGISQDGEVFEGRGWDVRGGHTSGKFMGDGLSNNANGYGVIFLLGGDQAPSQEALDAFSWLVEVGARKHEVPKLTTPHTIAAPDLATLCPGRDLIRITQAGYFLNTRKSNMTLEQSKATVSRAYVEILGREADEAGLNYWAGLLAENTISIEDIRWNFLVVRLGADKAFDAALSAKVDNPRGVEAAVIANQAFEQFLDNLAAFAAAEADHA